MSLQSRAPVLSIVVGTYNRLDQIKNCVESIRAETITPYCIYVTDAGSTDGTVEYLKSIEAPDLKPILVGEKLGQARAYNDVFEGVTSKYVCWLSDDNVVVSNGLDKAVRILESDKKIGMVGLKVKDQRGPFVKAPYIGGLSVIGILNINQGMLPSTLMRKVGGFSEAFRDYGIDPDLTAKVLYSGHDIVYTRNVALHRFRNWNEDPNSADYQALNKRHQNASDVYHQKYGGFARMAIGWNLCRGFWWLFRKAAGKRLPLNGTTPLLGHLPRDWHNLFSGRYINPLEIFHSNELYHLRQHCPPYALPTIPLDPPLPTRPTNAVL